MTTDRRITIVGLGGASGTGKSTLARRVASQLKGQTISMETYSMSADHLTFEERAQLNYDEPNVIDIKLLTNDIRKYLIGHAIEAPIYDFAHHLRLIDRRQHVPVTPLLIVEGILALHFPELRPHYDLAIYLEAPEEVCFRRRQVRDITERQRSLQLIRWQWNTTVLPAAKKYVLPSKRYADCVIDVEPEMAAVEKNLRDAIIQKLAQQAKAQTSAVSASGR